MSLTRRFVIWLLILAGFVLFIYTFSSIMLPFVAGILLAYFLDPLTEKLTKWIKIRPLACLLSILLFFTIIISVFLMIIPILEAQIIELASRAPTYFDLLYQKILPLIEKAQAYFSTTDTTKIQEAAQSYANKFVGWTGQILGAVWTSGWAIFNFFALILLTPIVTFYLLRDWPKFIAWFRTLFPRKNAAVIEEQLDEMNKMLSSYIRGQSSVCIILAIYYAAALSIAGLNFGLLIGMLSGLMAFVPYLGFVIGAGLALIMVALQSPTWLDFGLVIGIYGLGQMIESYFLTPRLVGRSIRLHEVWVIFALMAGGSMLGFVGILLAVPAAAVIGVLVRFAFKQYRQSSLYHGQSPKLAKQK